MGSALYVVELIITGVSGALPSPLTTAVVLRSKLLPKEPFIMSSARTLEKDQKKYEVGENRTQDT